MNITFYTALLHSHQNDMNLIITRFLFRLSGDNTGLLSGSYRQNSEFLKKDCASGSRERECESRGSVSLNVTPTKPMTWDTLKKIRRQKSCRVSSDLKKYQSSVCLLEQPQNSFISLQPEPETEKSFRLNQFLKYEDVYRSSPALRSVNSFICHEEGARQRRNNNLTFSKQFSASALKFTG